MKECKILILISMMLLFLAGCGKSESSTFEELLQSETETGVEQAALLSKEDAIEMVSSHIYDLDVLEKDTYKCTMSQIEINEMTENSLIVTGIFSNEYFITNRPVTITCKIEGNEIVEWEDEEHLKSSIDSPLQPIVPFDISMIEEMNLTVCLDNWTTDIYELNSDELQVEYLTEHENAYWESTQATFPMRITDSEGKSYIVTDATFVYQPTMVTLDEWDGSPSWYVLRGAGTSFNDVDLYAVSESMFDDFYK